MARKVGEMTERSWVGGAEQRNGLEVLKTKRLTEGDPGEPGGAGQNRKNTCSPKAGEEQTKQGGGRRRAARTVTLAPEP